MKRRLLIMRHAKSSWDDASLADHQRPLNKRGKRDALRMGEELEAVDCVPEIIITSDSQRTTETYSIMTEAFSEMPEIESTRAFYGGDVSDISDALDALPDHISTVMVLGHNPGWTTAVGYFSNDYVEMTTANIAILECDSETWVEATSQGGFVLKTVLRPKELD